MLNLEIKCGKIGEGIIYYNEFIDIESSKDGFRFLCSGFESEDFYINLDIIRKFRIKKSEKIPMLIMPAGGSYPADLYNFTGIQDYIEFDLKGREELTLLFHDHIEFDRIKRILTEKLCAK